MKMNYLLPRSNVHHSFVKPLFKKCEGFPKSRIKRFLQNRKVKRFVITLGIVFCTFLWIFCVQIPQDRAKRALELKDAISQTLGTRLTAVRLLPGINTTRFQPTVQCDERTFGVILIKSTPLSFKRRNALRNSWFKFAPMKEGNIKAFFFIGLPGNTNLTQSLRDEAYEHQDMIIEDLEENYYLLALKTLRILKWFSSSSCSKVPYFMKTDDDMFIHIPNIISHINSVPQAWVNYIGGQLHISDPVDTDPYSKWFAPADWWPNYYYPPFVSGALTVISSEVVPLLLNASLTVPLFHLEDVFLVGMIGYEKLNLLPNNIPGIESNSPKWIVRLKMALSSKDLAKSYIAFHCPHDLEFIAELYSQATSQ